MYALRRIGLDREQCFIANVLKCRPPGNRDPKVIWHEPTKRWVMVVARPDRQAVMFYGSDDLKRWEQLGEFGGEGAVNGIWECPDLFPLPVDGDPENVKWVLTVNLNPGGPNNGSAGQYFIGDFDGTTFTSASTPSITRSTSTPSACAVKLVRMPCAPG